jgi:hypothetical protein
MKKILPKIVSTALVLLLAFTMFGVFMPASEVEAGKSNWSQINDPNSGGSGATFVVADSEVIDIEVCDDGTMFAAIRAEAGIPFYTPALVAGDFAILKSTSGGATWKPTGFTPVNVAADQIVDIAASQAYSEDTTLWVALANSVQRTINGGTTFGAITPVLGVGETITSIDVAPDYLGAGLNAVVGTAIAAANARVILYTERAGGWGQVDAAGWGAAQTAAWVAFSPNYENDGEIVAVTTTGVVTTVRASFQERTWDSEVLASIPLQQEHTANNIVAVDAALAFPDDYDSLSNINFFVAIDSGVAAAGSRGDAFRIIGQRFGSPTPSIRIDLNAHASKEFDTSTIACSGSGSDITVFVGGAASNDVRRTSNPKDSSPSWRGAGKRATGTVVTGIQVANDYATSGIVYASTSDGLTAESGIARAEGGSIFNGIACIDTPIVAMLDFAAASTTEFFLVTSDGAAGPESLWRSTNGGKNWQRVHATAQTAGMTSVVVSPDYANDSTVYAGHIGATQMWKSANGGDTFTGISAREAINAWTVVDSTTLFVAGASTEVWKSSNSGLRWSRTQTKPTGTANNIVISPNFNADDSILIGNATNGRVYLSQDGGLNFRKQGDVTPGGSGAAVFAAFDNAYADSGIIFATPANVGGLDVEGVYRWTVGESTAWDQINANLAPAAAAFEAGGLAVADGVLYASDAIAGRGMQRSVSPKAPLQFAPGAFAAVGGGLLGTATMGDIEVVDGLVVSIDTANNRLNGFSDTLNAATTLTGPKTNAVVSGSSITLTWGSLPDATQYERELRLDSKYTVASGVADLFTTATSDVLTNLTAGFTYYWRVRSTAPVRSPWAKGSFIVKLATPGLNSPNPQEVFEVPIRPQFSWTSVGGATAYELQLADNPFFADAWVKKPLTHTVWVWDEDLEYSTTYYWRVKAVKSGRGITPTESNWREGAFTTMSEAAPTAPTAPEIIVQPAPVTTVPAPAPAPPQPITIPQPIAPVYLWAIIIIGAVLIIALIVLIVRTRRVV